MPALCTVAAARRLTGGWPRQPAQEQPAAPGHHAKYHQSLGSEVQLPRGHSHAAAAAGNTGVGHDRMPHGSKLRCQMRLPGLSKLRALGHNWWPGLVSAYSQRTTVQTTPLLLHACPCTHSPAGISRPSPTCALLHSRITPMNSTPIARHPPKPCRTPQRQLLYTSLYKPCRVPQRNGAQRSSQPSPAACTPFRTRPLSLCLSLSRRVVAGHAQAPPGLHQKAAKAREKAQKAKRFGSPAPFLLCLTCSVTGLARS
jgi:hypothetical protein